MTPVKKSNLDNLSQSVSMNLSNLAKHKHSEEARVKKNFKELRQLLDVREKWLLKQLDQLTNSQLSIMRSQKKTIDDEASMCKEDAFDNTYCLPLYKFSDTEMPSFISNYDRVRDAVLQFGDITTENGKLSQTETKSALDEIESEKWLCKSDLDWEEETASTISKDRRSSFVNKEDLDEWLLSSVQAKKTDQIMSDLVKAWTLRDSECVQKQNQQSSFALTEVEKTSSCVPNTTPNDYKLWIKREACRLNCPAVENNNSNNHRPTASPSIVSSAATAPVVEIEDLTQLKCFLTEEPATRCNSPSSDWRQWLAVPASTKRSTIPTANSYSALSDCATSRCSSVSNFCEANEMCSNFDECLADDSRCLNRYNEWLMSSSKRPLPPKARMETEDLSLWLAKSSSDKSACYSSEQGCPVLGCSVKDANFAPFYSKKSNIVNYLSSGNDTMDWFENGSKDNADFWLAGK